MVDKDHTKLLKKHSIKLEEIVSRDCQIQYELGLIKNNPRVKHCPNIILEGEKVEPILSPCFGDPINRDILGGGYIHEKAFIFPGSTVVHEDGNEYIKAGPRLHIAIHPSQVKAAILTCGGLCPGLNVVIREIVMSLWFNYEVKTIYGIKFGYSGIYAPMEESYVEMTPEKVSDIHTQGGTILGSSRGGFDQVKIVDALVKNGINMLFIIGGDGTHRGINDIYTEVCKRKLKIVVAGIPKTIDNDIPIIDRTFGFESAVEQAVKVIQSANVEANSAVNGIGLVKLFGRSCGFISLNATLASRDVNICLIPESKFELYGDRGLLEYIMNRTMAKGHSVIVVAEGAGDAVLDLKIEDTGETDKSGNKKLPDIGNILKNEIADYAKKKDIDITLKYIDPTYIIRTCPANSFDTLYCSKLAHNAVHSAFAGYTNFSSGFINNKTVIIPISLLITSGHRKIDTVMNRDFLYMLGSTGQPAFLNKKI